jgi:hypothetical protein
MPGVIGGGGLPALAAAAAVPDAVEGVGGGLPELNSAQRGHLRLVSTAFKVSSPTRGGKTCDTHSYGPSDHNGHSAARETISIELSKWKHERK